MGPRIKIKTKKKKVKMEFKITGKKHIVNFVTELIKNKDLVIQVIN